MPAPAPPDAVAALLVSHPDLVPRAGRALDVACGLGATAVWLATRGLDVVAVDVSPVAVEAARRLAAQHGIADRCRIEVVDLDDPRPDRPPFDSGPFDVIVCQRFRDPAMYPLLRTAVAPHGLLVVTVLSVVGRADTSSPFLAQPGELASALAGDGTGREIVASVEDDGEASIVVRFAG